MFEQYPFTVNDDIALRSHNELVTYKQLYTEIARRQQYLMQLGATRFALLADNSVEWVYFDLACQLAGFTVVPIPAFFSAQQCHHLYTSAGIEYIISASEVRDPHTEFKVNITQYTGKSATVVIPDGTQKITFTSGSTGQPKGVCLSFAAQMRVARSLTDAVGIQRAKHLAILPFSLLLENIAGIYSPLLSGGEVLLSTSEERGFIGSRLDNPNALIDLISEHRPHSIILVPELLLILVNAASCGWQPPSSLTFVAVGGGLVAAEALAKASALALPVYQGYGLSECCSVVALNTPNQQVMSAVGHCLAHNTVNIVNDEIVVSGSHFLGYLNDPSSFYPDHVATGDLGHLQDGFLYVDGRRKNVLINSWGRNISPEWIEAELFATGAFRHVVVIGDGKPCLVALYCAISNDIDTRSIDTIFNTLNARLPDYAKLFVWQPFSPAPTTQNGCLTATGKPIRTAINQFYDSAISSMYLNERIQETA